MHGSPPTPTWQVSACFALGRSAPAGESWDSLAAMEAAGIEPASAVAPNRTSTSVVRACSHPPAGSRTTCRRASHPEESRRGRLALPWRRARSLAPVPGPRAQPGSTSPYLDSTRRRVRDHASHLLLVPVDL